MGLSTCHHLYKNIACLSMKLSFSKTFFMNFHRGVKSLEDCPAHWMKLLATISDSKPGEPGVLECWETQAVLNQGMTLSFLSIPLRIP